jgi:hypothetical protein
MMEGEMVNGSIIARHSVILFGLKLNTHFVEVATKQIEYPAIGSSRKREDVNLSI